MSRVSRQCRGLNAHATLFAGDERVRKRYPGRMYLGSAEGPMLVQLPFCPWRMGSKAISRSCVSKQCKGLNDHATVLLGRNEFESPIQRSQVVLRDL